MAKNKSENMAFPVSVKGFPKKGEFVVHLLAEYALK